MFIFSMLCLSSHGTHDSAFAAPLKWENLHEISIFRYPDWLELQFHTLFNEHRRAERWTALNYALHYNPNAQSAVNATCLFFSVCCFLLEPKRDSSNKPKREHTTHHSCHGGMRLIFKIQYAPSTEAIRTYVPISRFEEEIGEINKNNIYQNVHDSSMCEQKLIHPCVDNPRFQHV